AASGSVKKLRYEDLKVNQFICKAPK
ncbi:hypothetical protein DBR06_SOUSAS3610007, partial [Sousa chinensis]